MLIDAGFVSGLRTDGKVVRITSTRLVMCGIGAYSGPLGYNTTRLAPFR